MSAIPSNLQTQPGAAAPNDAYRELSSEDFFRIIFTELQSQDPLQPNDSQALLEQISTIRSIESDLNLAENLEDIARQGELASAGNLVGNFVTGKIDSGLDVAGFVDSVTVTAEGLSVNLSSGYQVKLDDVTEIVDPALFAAPDSAAPTVNNGVPNTSATAGAEFAFTFPTDDFADEDPTDVLSYAASLSDGSELPDWLDFDPETRTFTGTPSPEDIGQYIIRLTATDSFNQSVSTTFRINVSMSEAEPDDAP